MNPNRLAILVTGAVAVTGSGAILEVLSSRSVASVVSPNAARATQPAITTSSADPSPAKLSPPQQLQPQLFVAATQNSASAGTIAVSIVDTTGRVRATTVVPTDAQWTISAGPGAAYWVTGGTLQKLDTQGAVTTLASVPATQSGRVVISPDGMQWAYATMSQTADGVVTNRLYRGSVDAAAQLVAQRIADPNHPAADAPGLRQFYLDTWTDRGLLIERQPVGGCGCGVPFDMQMSAGYSAFIDPMTGSATPLTQSDTCPLSGVAADGTAACFHASATGTSDSVRFVTATRATAQYPLSGTTLGGDATFDGLTVAYATVPQSAGGCGGPDWRTSTTLRVINARTGSAYAVGPAGLQPVAWLKTGAILATQSTADAAGTTTSVVEIDPLTAHLTTLATQTDRVVGLA